MAGKTPRKVSCVAPLLLICSSLLGSSIQTSVASTACSNCVRANYGTLFTIDSLPNNLYTIVGQVERYVELINPGNQSVQTTIYTGDLAFSIPTPNLLSSVTLVDSKGVAYPVLQQGGNYGNQQIGVTLSASSKLTVGLVAHLKPQPAAIAGLVIHLNLSANPFFTPGPTHVPVHGNISLSLPSPFTVLSPSGGVELTVGNRTMLTWSELAGPTTLPIEVLPFHTSNLSPDYWNSVVHPREYNGTLVVSELFPSLGYCTVYAESRVDVTSDIGGKAVLLGYPLPLPMLNDTPVVISVRDSLGPLTRIEGPLGAGQNLTGYYYVDYLTDQVFTYPRFIVRDGFDEFDVTLEYRVGPKTPTYYTGQFSAEAGVNLTPLSTPFVTGNETTRVFFEVILPNNVQVDASLTQPKNYTVGVSPDGRPSVSWELTSSANSLNSLGFLAGVDITPLVNASYIGLLFLLAAGAWLIAVLLWRKVSAHLLADLLGIPAGIGFPIYVLSEWGTSVAFYPIIVLEEVSSIVIFVVGGIILLRRNSK